VQELGRDSFPVLFVDVLTRRKRFDDAVYFAKNRVAGRGSQEARRTFGVPGYYVAEPSEATPRGAAPVSPSRRLQPSPHSDPPEAEKPK
jgi:hypothetical protein